VGASWKVADDWRLHVRYGEGKQAADSLNPRPGLTLGDDRQRKAEIGLDGRFNRLFNPGLNFFRRIVENEKYVDGYSYRAVNNSNFICRQGAIPASGPQSPAVTSDMLPCYNQSNTERIGVEFSLSGNFAERSSYRTSVTHFTRLSGEASGENTPRRIADLSVSHGFGAFTFTAALKHVSRYATTVGGYTRYDLGLGYDWKFGATPIRTTLYGRNLGDEKYETNAGIQDGGRVLGLELTASF
jgi:outer membrane cobalamin receptor